MPTMITTTIKARNLIEELRFFFLTQQPYWKWKRFSLPTSSAEISLGALDAFGLICVAIFIKKLLQITEQFRFVPKVGIEPTLPEEHEFESCASASSATLAFSLEWTNFNEIYL